VSRTFRALGVRNYRRYAAGQLVANTGIWMQRVAQDWLVLELTDGSATALGITVGLQFLPMLLLGLWGGSLADRFPRRRLLMVTSAAMGLLAAVLGVVVLTGSATVGLVMVLAFALGSAAALDSPARQAFVSEMVDVEDLPNAVALGTASFNLGRVIGPSVAGLLIALVGTGWVFVINAFAFGAVLVALLGVRTAELRTPVAPGRDSGGLRVGLRYVWQRPELVMVMVVAFFVGTFGLNFSLTIALMTTQVFDGGPEAFGLASTVLALGSLSGSLAAARRGAPRLRLVILAAVGFGLAAVTVSLMPTYVTFLVALPLVGIGALTLINAMQSFLQLNSDPGVRGRVLGIYGLVFLGGTPLGSPIVGWIAETLGPRWSIGLGGVISATAAVVAGLFRMRGGGVRVQAHLTPRPHMHIADAETLASVRPVRRVWLSAGPRVVALPALVVGLVVAGLWWAGPSRADDTELPAAVAFTVRDPAVREASGMVAGRAQPGLTWIVNDSGNPAKVYGVDGDGATRSVLRLRGATNRDWEGLAPGTDAEGNPTLWVGDIGDNDGQRASVQVYEVLEPARAGVQTVSWRRYQLEYPDGPHDAETLLVDPADQSVIVVTKQIVGAGIYRAAALVPGETTVLERVASAPSFVTDGTYAPSGGTVVLRTYTYAYLLPAVTDAPSTQALLPAQPQGETIAWSIDGRSLLAGSEGARSAVYRLELPDEWVAAPAADSTASGPAHEPGVPTWWVLAAGVLLLAAAVTATVRRAARRRSESTG
jgi:MFS family permease